MDGGNKTKTNHGRSGSVLRKYADDLEPSTRHDQTDDRNQHLDHLRERTRKSAWVGRVIRRGEGYYFGARRENGMV